MSSEWDWVDDELYAKKSTIYTFKPEIPVGIRANSVALANYGGPIALVPTKFSDGISDSRDDQGDTVRFYNSAGKLFPSKSAAPSGASAYPDSSLSLSRQMSDGDVSMEVVCVGWTRRQSLITVTRGGLAQIHRGPVDPEPHTVTLAEFQPGDVVQLAVIDGDCLALLTSSMQLFVSSNLHSEDPYCVRYPDPPLDPTRPPNDMLIMPIDMDTMYADEDVMEVMIPLYPSGVVLMTSSEAKGQLSEWNNSQIAVMSLHPGKEKVIVCTVDMKVSVLSLDFETTFLSVDVSDQIDGLLTPEGAGWVGGMEDDIDNGLVILTFESPPWCRGGAGALGISASGETVSWGINTGQGDALAMVQECDCVRIATAEEHVRIEVVPPSSVAMFTVASTDPVAMLKDAWDAFEKRDPNADEAVKLLVEAEQLDDAVEHCIEAALFESEKKMQVSLLSAAAYGSRASADNASDLNEQVREAATVIRVLNNLRVGRAGCPLTSIEYDRMTPERLVDRLLHANMHSLALGICESVHVPKDIVIIHWVCKKLENTPPHVMSDSDMLEIINKKLSNVEGVSVSSIAQIAHITGRRNLALRIMEREPLARGKVFSLLSMSEHAGAIRCAMASLDTDLVYFTMFQCKEALTYDEFFGLISRIDGAASLMVKFWKQHGDHDTLMQYLNSQDGHEQSGRYFLEEADKRSGMDVERAGYLTMATNAFKQATLEAKDPEEKRRMHNMKLTTSDRCDLEKSQNQLSSSLVGRSLHQTIFDAVCRQQISLAEDIARQFKVPRKAYNLCLIKGLVRTHAWDALEKLAKLPSFVKETNGMRPFVEECLKEGKKDVALKLAIMSTNKRVQMECFILLKVWEEAGDLAIHLGDEKALSLIMQLCKDVGIGSRLREKAEQGMGKGAGASKCAQQ
jgi:hypothetical protein|eukprot:g3242.t1